MAVKTYLAIDQGKESERGILARRGD